VDSNICRYCHSSRQKPRRNTCVRCIRKNSAGRAWQICHHLRWMQRTTANCLHTCVCSVASVAAAVAVGADASRRYFQTRKIAPLDGILPKEATTAFGQHQQIVVCRGLCGRISLDGTELYSGGGFETGSSRSRTYVSI
jgi:hypothetical protein